MKWYAVSARPEPARVVLVQEEVRVTVPEGHVEMAAVAGQVRERFRHEGGEDVPAFVTPLPLGELVDHVAEEDRAVAARERVRVGEVLLELAVRVLVVVGVVAPPQLVHVARDRGEEFVVAREAVQVVAGLLQRVERVGEPDGAVLQELDEEVLELEAHLELEALACCAAASWRRRIVRGS